MSSNSLGTIIRIAMISIGLLFVWFTATGIFYFTVSKILGFDFSLYVWIFFFIFLLFFRMFYPKNVFI